MSDEPIWYSIPVSGELYERLERAAQARGKSIDQMAEEILGGTDDGRNRHASSGGGR